MQLPTFECSGCPVRILQTIQMPRSVISHGMHSCETQLCIRGLVTSERCKFFFLVFKDRDAHLYCKLYCTCVYGILKYMYAT